MANLAKIKQDMRKLMAVTAETYRETKKRQRERLSLSEPVKNAIERVVLLRNRVRYRFSSRAKNKARAAALIAVRQTLDNAVKWKANNIKTVFNISLYLLLLDQDLAYFTGDLVLAIGDRR